MSTALPTGTWVRLCSDNRRGTYGGARLAVGNCGRIAEPTDPTPEGTQLVVFKGRVSLVDGSYYFTNPEDPEEPGIRLYLPRDCVEVCTAGER